MAPAAAPPEPGRRARWSTGRILGAVVSALVVGGFIALLVIGLQAREVDTSIDRAIARGEPKPAPQFTLPVLANGDAIGKREGAPLSLTELRGRPVILNFWASWCTPCKREAPILEGAWRAGRPQGAVVLGLDIQDLKGEALDFIAEHGVTYPQVRDKSDKTDRDYGLTGVPETFFVRPDGTIARHWIGPLTDAQIHAFIEEMLR